MKKGLICILALLIGAGLAFANQEVTTTSVVTIASRAVNDTGTYATPDSVRIVTYRQGVEAFDAWFNSADGECSALNDQLVFFDAFGDIDGDAGTGIYQLSACFRVDDDDLWVNTWYQLVDTTTQTYGSLGYWKTSILWDTDLTAYISNGNTSAGYRVNTLYLQRWLSTEIDSLTKTIEDANKANFKATGFAVAGDPMTLQSDSLKTLMTDVDGIKAKSDSLNFQGLARGTGLAVNLIRVQGDSVTADNLEKAFDGDTTWGTNAGISATTVFVRPEAGNTHAVEYRGLGGGDGLNIAGYDGISATGTGDYGIYAIGADDGIQGRGSAGAGILGIGTTAGMELQGTSTDDLVLGSTGHIRGWMDSVLYIESVSTQVTAIQAYLGAGDSWRQHLMPFASANKDSIRTFNAGTCNSTIYLFKDDSDATVLDSITQEIW